MKIAGVIDCLLPISNIRLTGLAPALPLLQLNRQNQANPPAVFLMAAGCIILALLLIVVAMLRRNKGKQQQLALLHADYENLENDMHELAERNDWLVTEMHHRVKNNLQILNSLLNSQLSYVTDNCGREVLYNSKHRLYAISLVHQKLFQTSMISVIDMGNYIKELADYLADEFRTHGRIKFNLNLIALPLDISVAIPLAQIINELISNALKYAFPGDNKGEVTIRLSTTGKYQYRLVFADNGVGLPGGTDFNSGRSLGKSLIMGLAGQIKAVINVESGTGLTFTIDFKSPKTQLQQLAAN